MKTIKGDLILKKDTVFNESITVEGNIVCKLQRVNLTVEGNITANDIDAGNINAWNITANDITAGDINAGDITANDITAGDINARNINAKDIDYYAVCFAYQNIVCKSIKGRRGNTKHFCLDGQIKIKEAKK